MWNCYVTVIGLRRIIDCCWMPATNQTSQYSGEKMFMQWTLVSSWLVCRDSRFWNTFSLVVVAVWLCWRGNSSWNKFKASLVICGCCFELNMTVHTLFDKFRRVYTVTCRQRKLFWAAKSSIHFIERNAIYIWFYFLIEIWRNATGLQCIREEPTVQMLESRKVA